MKAPANLKYTASHEWILLEGGQATVGITDFAVAAIKEIVFLELPPLGKDIPPMKPFGVIESVKAVFDLNAPLGGKISAVNSPLADNFDALMKDPYGKGWLVKMALSSTDTGHLMDAAAYEKFCESEHH